MREYFIIFHDSDEPHLRWMKKGFRHAFMVIWEDHRLISLNLLAGSYEISTCESVSKSVLFKFWRDQGYKFKKVEPGNARVWLPGPLSCVSVIKRFLGLVKPTIITPWQLFSYLDKI